MAEAKDDVNKGDSYTSDNCSEGSFTYLYDKNREIHTKGYIRGYRKWFVILTVAAAVLAIILARVYRNTSCLTSSSDRSQSMPMELMRDVDERVMSMFVEFDTNMDGAIDLGEFAPIANRILDRKETTDKRKLPDPKPEDTWNFSGELITIESHFIPLVLSSMSKYNVPSALGFDYSLEGLKKWKTAALSEDTFPVSAFSVFLPWDKQLVGEVWYLIHPMISRYGPGLSNNRYTPPVAQGKVAILFRLLTMFHPRPFLMTRFGPQGTIACIRAQNKDYVDIVFRMHAEFQLNVAPLLPFWFTPAQFLGNIIIKRDGSHVKSFRLAVPCNKSLNVDMEWMIGQKNEQQTEPGHLNDPRGDNNEVDIGFLPRMELVSVGPSQPPTDTDTTAGAESILHDKDTAHNKDILWDSEISFEEAHRALEIKMYPFKKVPYLSFQDAFTKAKLERKLVHHILLWGALDDQSC